MKEKKIDYKIGKKDYEGFLRGLRYALEILKDIKRGDALLERIKELEREALEKYIDGTDFTIIINSLGKEEEDEYLLYIRPGPQ